MSLNDLLIQYLNEIETTKSHNTYLTYDNALRVWFNNGKVQINLPYIREVINTWDCSQNTKVIRCKILKKFIDYSKSFIEIQDFPDIVEVLSDFKKKETEPEFVSVEQYKDIMNCCTNQKLKVCIQLMFENGLRSDEVLDIRSKDYDPTTKTIIIRNTKDDNVYNIMIADCLNENLKIIFDDSYEYLIHTRTGRRFANSNFRKEIKALCVKAGYPELHCHSFRHGSAMFLLENNVDMLKIQKHLRHKSGQSTRKYLNYTKEQKPEIIELFSNLL